MFGRVGIVVLAMLAACSVDAQTSDSGIKAAGDAMPAPLTGAPGDPLRGRAAVVDREGGNCLLCHALPIPGERFQGDLGPALNGVGSRLSAGEIRARIVDASKINPLTIMPPYFRTAGLTRVAKTFEGRPILGAGQIEDIVAYLAGLKD